ncbi:phenylacetate-CoA ligase [Candidatus Magnetomoraceae bacterium gMMP-13]
MLSIINRKIIYPLYFAWNKDKRLQYLKEMEKGQWLSQDEILSRQLIKFKRLFKYAYENSPFYRKLYIKAGVTPEDINSFDDIRNLPVITKQDIQKNMQTMVSTTFPKCDMYLEASGGSTGNPTNFYADKYGRPRKGASSLMFNQWAGWNIGEKVFYLWGADREDNRVRALKEKIVQKLIFRNYIFNAFDITEDGMRMLTQLLIREKPSLIIAYANVAALIAKYLEKLKIRGIRAKGVICSAETLTDENQKIIERVFNCHVLNRYGSREVGLISAECDHHEGLHINAENLLVEFKSLEKYNNGQKFGEIIVTDFNNRAMPFIRYNMGDIAKPINSKCSCGRGLPLMSRIYGRTSDFIKHPNGGLIHGEYFSHIFYGMKNIRQFQVIQESLDTFDIKVVASERLATDMKQFIISKVYEIMGNNVHVNIIELSDIPIPSSGKFRFTISKI